MHIVYYFDSILRVAWCICKHGAYFGNTVDPNYLNGFIFLGLTPKEAITVPAIQCT